MPVSASAPARPEPLPIKRLIVLVPPDDVDEAVLARRIWTMALHERCEVLYVALVRDVDYEARARRSLALLASMTRDARLQVATHLAFQSQWLKALRPLYQPGDAIVCLAEQTVKRLGRSAQPLSQQLVGRIWWTSACVGRRQRGTTVGAPRSLAADSRRRALRHRRRFSGISDVGHIAVGAECGESGGIGAVGGRRV